MNVFEIKFSTDNALFEDVVAGNAEIARILRDIANKVEAGGYGNFEQPVIDLNGNKIGTWIDNTY